MCQILAVEFKDPRVFEPNKDFFSKDLEKLLSVKGGVVGASEGYSLTLSYKYDGEVKVDTLYGSTFKELKKAFKKIKKYLKVDVDSNIIVTFFSRQRPEMETEDHSLNISPYHNKKLNKLFFVHGTISNDKELYPDVKIDTEVFSYVTKKELKGKLKGLYSYIEIDLKDNSIKMVDRGMGAYQKNTNSNTIYSTTKIEDFYNPHHKQLAMVPNLKKKKKYNIKIAFSGGMDSCLNTFKILSDLNKSGIPVSVELCYFEYGARSEREEMLAVINFKKYIIENKFFENINLTSSSIPMKNFLNEIGSITREYSKLTDENSVGDITETETTSAYVPFRNTQMAILLMGKIQKETSNTKAMIGFGLNLSDGQVYGDNNIAWLEYTEKMLSYGGKKFQKVKLLSPYINRTKINMLKEFKNEFDADIYQELLDISFSCYYPENGKACGKCGSCLLRTEAIKKNEK